MSRSAAQKAEVRTQAQKRWIKTARRRGTMPPTERETLAEYQARGGGITVCEPVVIDEEAAIARARRASRRERNAASPREGGA